jgi:TusA-related sulfurtransferase
MNPNFVLNCIGQSCPEPLIKTRYTLENMEKGDMLKILVDDPASEGDIRNLLAKRGHKLAKFEWDDRKVVFWVKI